jgi:hypothetical protein
MVEKNKPQIVHVSVEFTRLGEIDTMNDKYNAEICIESKWIEKDHIQNYNPGTTLESTIVYRKYINRTKRKNQIQNNSTRFNFLILEL